MKIKDIQNVIELLKLANFNEEREEVKDFEKDELNINQNLCSYIFINSERIFRAFSVPEI